MADEALSWTDPASDYAKWLGDAAAMIERILAHLTSEQWLDLAKSKSKD
jgi:hypothetical protein